MRATQSESDTNLASNLLGASLTLVSLSIPVLVGLFAAYKGSWGWTPEAREYIVLMWGVLSVMIISAAVAGISLALLWGARIPLWLPTGIMVVLIASVALGSIFWMLIVIN